MAITFDIETSKFGTITADHVESDIPDINNRTRGETATYNFQVTNDADFADLLEFDRHAGSYSLNPTLGNDRKYRENIPSSANINSLLVGINPATELTNEDIAGVWGLVSNASDNRTRALTNPVVSLEITILSEYSEYADRTAVETALKI